MHNSSPARMRLGYEVLARHSPRVSDVGGAGVLGAASSEAEHRVWRVRPARELVRRYHFEGRLAAPIVRALRERVMQVHHAALRLAVQLAHRCFGSTDGLAQAV
eukprot:128339-Rhodomonas_salina.3